MDERDLYLPVLLDRTGDVYDQYRLRGLPDSFFIDDDGVLRAMLGPTNGLEAPPGTIRGDFGSSRQMNLVHASDGPEAAAREIGIYFTDKEIHAYEPTIGTWLRAADE